MHKKTIAVVLVMILAMASVCYAQGARNASPLTLTHARTNFTNVGATGEVNKGTPGYVVLTGVRNDYQWARNPIEYYLWVDDTGDLCMASYATISAYASFPSGNWSDINMRGACTKIGSQS